MTKNDLPFIWGVDFDETLFFNAPPFDEGRSTYPNADLIEFLKVRKSLGDAVILVTMRENITLQIALDLCANAGLTFDAVNDNHPALVEFYGTNPRKIHCDRYIDDKNISMSELPRLYSMAKCRLAR